MQTMRMHAHNVEMKMLIVPAHNGVHRSVRACVRLLVRVCEREREQVHRANAHFHMISCSVNDNARRTLVHTG